MLNDESMMWTHLGSILIGLVCLNANFVSIANEKPQVSGLVYKAGKEKKNKVAKNNEDLRHKDHLIHLASHEWH